MTSVCLLAGVSCSTSILTGKRKTSAAAAEKPAAVFQYSAVAGLASNEIPTRVYLFPPLRSDAKGSPVESLKPVLDAGGEIIDWRASSGSADALLRKMSGRLSQIGYQVVDFKTVVNAPKPYSILIVSSFYTSEAVIKDAPAGDYDRSQSVMIKASVFDVDLDPRHKIDLLKVDGLMNYASGKPPARPLERCFEETMRWFGDNVQGSALLN
jgi:hypothetical protein